MDSLEERTRKINIDWREYGWNLARHMPYLYIIARPALLPVWEMAQKKQEVLEHYASKSWLELAAFGIGTILTTAGFFMKHHIDEKIEKIKENITSPSPTLETEGQFRYTRNPLYVAQTIVAAGAALMEPSLAVAGAFCAYLGLTQKCVKTEEQVCEKMFEEKYRNYKNTHPRWPNRWGVACMVLETFQHYKQKLKSL